MVLSWIYVNFYKHIEIEGQTLMEVWYVCDDEINLVHKQKKNTSSVYMIKIFLFIMGK